MAEIDSRPTIEVKIIISLNESEARALAALTGYNFSDFRDAFYAKLGRNYLEPHEDGLFSLFKSIKEIMPREFKKIDEARKLFNKNHRGG